MESIDINLGDLEPISLNLNDDFGSGSGSGPSASSFGPGASSFGPGASSFGPGASSFGPGASSFGPGASSFGSGIELLMNDKKRNASHNVNIDLGDLDKLENELNELSGNSGNSKNVKFSANTNTSANTSGGSFFGDTKSLSGIASSLFGFGSAPSASNTKPVEEIEQNDSRLGHSTAESMGNTRTWDGYSKMNDAGDIGGSGPSARLSEKDKRRKKRAMIKKLEEWSDKGFIKNGTRFSMDSPYDEVEDEYETALEDKRKKDSIKLQGWWFMTAVNSIEYANSAFNPFDLNLDGWGEQVSEDIDSYEEIFAELHDKYKGGKLAPELSLLLRLGFSACMVNFTNKALSSATPGFNDVIKQSPELMKMFTEATVQNMSQKSPGFAFANNLVNNPDAVNTSFGPPPKPVETKSNPPTSRVSMNFTSNDPVSNRPDIAMGRGASASVGAGSAMFRESGVDVANTYADAAKSPAPIRTPNPSSQSARPEMRGPATDIDNILSGLKTKAVNIHEQTFTQEDDSMISISSLKDMQGGSMPKKSNRRKNRSDKNTVSLDI